MRFPVLFTRYKGTVPAGGTAIGTDALPTDSGGKPTKAQVSADNVLNSRTVSINGWPLDRIAFAGRYTGSGSPGALPVALYVFEDQLGMWMPLPQSATTYTPGTNAAPSGPIFFDAMSLIDFPHTQKDLNAVVPGAAQFLCIVSDTMGGTANGQYDFILGAELTSKPF